MIEHSHSLPRDGRRAGARAAGERLPDAAFPDPQVYRRTVGNAHESNIGAFGKLRVFLDGRPQPVDVGRRNTVDHEDTVRVAHRQD